MGVTGVSGGELAMGLLRMLCPCASISVAEVGPHGQSAHRTHGDAAQQDRDTKLVKNSAKIVALLSQGQQAELYAAFNRFDINMSGSMCAGAHRHTPVHTPQPPASSPAPLWLPLFARPTARVMGPRVHLPPCSHVGARAPTTRCCLGPPLTTCGGACAVRVRRQRYG